MSPKQQPPVRLEGHYRAANRQSRRTPFDREGRGPSALEAPSVQVTLIVGPHLNRRSGTDLSGIAEEINPQVRGWINYYGAFYRSELYSLAARIDQHLVRWARQKFKRLRRSLDKAWAWLIAVKQREPTLFAHWQIASSARRRSVGAG